MTNTIVIAALAILAITIMVVAGVATGHDGALLSGGIATVAGISAAFGAFKASAAKYPDWHIKRLEKEARDKPPPPPQSSSVDDTGQQN